MTTYFTVSKSENTYILDSFSKDYSALKNKFPKETIYQSDNPIKSIYFNKDQLIKVNGKEGIIRKNNRKSL